MLRARRSALTGYVVAVLSVVVMLGLALIFLPLMAQSTLLLFLGAIFINASLNGRTPGLLATLLSVCACAYLFLSSPGRDGMSTGSQPGDTASFVVFVVVAALVNWTAIARTQKRRGGGRKVSTTMCSSTRSPASKT